MTDEHEALFEPLIARMLLQLREAAYTAEHNITCEVPIDRGVLLLTGVRWPRISVLYGKKVPQLMSLSVTPAKRIDLNQARAVQRWGHRLARRAEQEGPRTQLLLIRRLQAITGWLNDVVAFDGPLFAETPPDVHEAVAELEATVSDDDGGVADQLDAELSILSLELA